MSGGKPIRQVAPEELEERNTGQHCQKLAGRYLEPGGLEEVE